MVNTALIIYISIFGLLLGSFFGMLEYRISSGKRGGVFGRSICPKCNRMIKGVHLIPIIGYMFQKGKCHHCGNKISEKYLIIEVFTTITFALLAATNMKIPEFTGLISRDVIEFFSINTHLFTILIITAILLFLAYYDALHKTILDRIALPTIIVTGLLIPFNLNTSASASMIGASIAVGFFLMQILVSQGRWLGGGDLRIAAIMGLLLGWQLTLFALFCSYFLGAIMAIPILLQGRKKNHEIPFAPFLTGGTIIALAWGDKIIEWYISTM